MRYKISSDSYCSKKTAGFVKWVSGFSLFFLIFLQGIPGYSELIRKGTLAENEHWSLEESPILIQGDVTIPKGIEVFIDAGVELQIHENAVITVLGRLDALGTAEQPIRFHPEGDPHWGAISYEGEGTGTLLHCLFERGRYASGSRTGVVNAYKCVSSVIIDSCTFTEWPDEFDAKATQGYDATQMVVRRCWFGEGENEAVHGDNSPILVEYNTFAQRYGYSDAVDIGTTQNPGPVIRYNIFLGSEDDAIDLDDCDAYVEGNWVLNCRGGSHDPIGISGDRTSRPIIVNNVVIDCETGIGFKNGANITCYNNTIIDCDKGFWMHQDPAHAKVYNTIIWGRDDQVSIKLEEGSTIDISYSIVKGEPLYPGEGNLNLDPRFADPVNLQFNLLADSPAIDTGWSGEGVLDYDCRGLSRVNRIDIGAFEFQPEEAEVLKWFSME